MSDLSEKQREENGQVETILKRRRDLVEEVRQEVELLEQIIRGVNGQKTPVFRWSGQYYGFISADGRLFDAKANYLGWVESDGLIWRKDGHFLGELVDSHYILRRTTMAPRAPRAPKTPPAPPVPMAPPAPRVPRVSRVGWEDVLGGL